jgi:serine/threonine protein kinase
MIDFVQCFTHLILLFCIFRLKPKHLALGDLFRKAQEYLSGDLSRQFNEFLTMYGKQCGMKRFVMGPKHELLVRRLDEAVSKIVSEVNLLLQVEEVYTLNNLSDALRVVLTSLKENNNGNQFLMKALEDRMVGRLDQVHSTVIETRQHMESINTDIRQVSKGINDIQQKLSSVPFYLRGVKNSEVRDLWRHREWPDCIPFEHFSKAMSHFIYHLDESINTQVKRKVSLRIRNEIKKIVEQDEHSSNYIVPSDLDRMIPPETGVLDYFLGIELGWIFVLESQMIKLGALLESIELNRCKVSRIYDQLKSFLSPVLELYSVPDHYKSNIVVLNQNRAEYFQSHWNSEEIDIFKHINRIIDEVEKYQEFDFMTSALIRRVDIELFNEVHQCIAQNGPKVLVNLFENIELEVNLISNALPEDVEKDELRNMVVLERYCSLRANLQSLAEDGFDMDKDAIMKLFYIRSEDVTNMQECGITGYNMSYSGIVGGIPVLLHSLNLKVTEYLPQPLAMYFRVRMKLNHPHGALLHLLGLTVINEMWTIVAELPASPMCTLATYLKEQGNALSIRTKLSMFHDVLSAVQFLHSHGYIMCTLSPHGILIDRKLNVKVVPAFQFGNWLNPGIAIADEYRAPEIVAGATIPSFSADVWSLGALLYRILLSPLETPHSIHPNQLSEMSVTEICIQVNDDALKSTLQQLIASCLRSNPMQRIDLVYFNSQSEQLLQKIIKGMLRESPQVATQRRVVLTPSHDRAGSEPTRTPSATKSYTSAKLSPTQPPSYRSTSDLSSQENQIREENYESYFSSRDVLQDALTIYDQGRGDIPSAISLFETAYIAHQQWESLIYLGDIFYFGCARRGHVVRKDYRRAYDYYFKATQKGLHLGHVGLGDCYLFKHGLPSSSGLNTLARLQQAEHHYMLAYRGNPNPTARLLCGIADLKYYRSQSENRLQYHIVNLDDEALRLYQQAHDLEPGYYRAKIGLADCYLCRRQVDHALDIYLEIADVMKLKRVSIGLALASVDHSDRDAYHLMAEEAEDW